MNKVTCIQIATAPSIQVGKYKVAAEGDCVFLTYVGGRHTPVMKSISGTVTTRAGEMGVVVHERRRIHHIGRMALVQQHEPRLSPLGGVPHAHHPVLARQAPPGRYGGHGGGSLEIRTATAPNIPGYRLCKALYSIDGISPCVNTGGGENIQPKIVIYSGKTGVNVESD